LKRHKELSEGFQKLTEELISEGYFDTDPKRFAERMAQAFVMFLVGLAISFLLGQTSIVWRIVAILVMTFAGGQGLWLGHEAGHNAFTGIRKYDRIFQIITFGMFLKFKIKAFFQNILSCKLFHFISRLCLWTLRLVMELNALRTSW